MSLYQDAVKQHGMPLVAAAALSTYALVAVISYELYKRESLLHPADSDRQFHLRMLVLAGITAALGWWCSSKKGWCKLVSLCAYIASATYLVGIVYPKVVLGPGLVLDTDLRRLYDGK